MGEWFNLHTHSQYSTLDGMGTVEALVERAVKMGYPALGLTDHGNMGGVVDLYTGCKKAGLVPFPGSELYLSHDLEKDAKRYHVSVWALSLEGYKGLVQLSSYSHKRENYHFKPRVDLPTFLSWGQHFGQHVAVATGCYFGVLVQTLLNDGHQRAVGVLQMLKRCFPNLYVECQHHWITHENGEHDDWLVAQLYKLAVEVGVRPLVTQDSHYCHQKHKGEHDTLKRLIIHGKDGDDAAFPGDSYHLATEGWVSRHYKRRGHGELEAVWKDGLDSIQELMQFNKLDIPGLNTYKFQVPEVAPNPYRNVVEQVNKFLNVSPSQTGFYSHRAKEELAVLGTSGMADYLLLVQKVCRYMDRWKILYSVRGSANGSLLCYALGITDVDPMVWGLGYERFLTTDRKKPPDIDLDIEATMREQVIQWLKSQHNVVQIGTYSKLGLKPNDQEGRGSVFVQYLAKKRKEMGATEYKAKFGDVQGIHDLPYEEAQSLNKMVQIGVRKAPGAHAAGFLVEKSTYLISDYIPTMLIPSSGLTVTQYEMDQVEQLGFMKLDLLGQRTLSTLRRALELVGRDPADKGEWIPNDDAATMKLIREGVPNSGLFQFDQPVSGSGDRVPA
jgi:DNA polymerase-3 subunit alpha